MDNRSPSSLSAKFSLSAIQASTALNVPNNQYGNKTVRILCSIKLFKFSRGEKVNPDTKKNPDKKNGVYRYVYSIGGLEWDRTMKNAHIPLIISSHGMRRLVLFSPISMRIIIVLVPFQSHFFFAKALLIWFTTASLIYGCIRAAFKSVIPPDMISPFFIFYLPSSKSALAS